MYRSSVEMGGTSDMSILVVGRLSISDPTDPTELAWAPEKLDTRDRGEGYEMEFSYIF